MTDTLEVAKPDMRTPVDLNFEPRLIEKSFDYKGTEVKIQYYQPTRLIRNKAAFEAMDVYAKEHPGQKNDDGMEGDITVLEREMACRMIKWWSLPKPPRVMWDWLPVDFGDKLIEVLELKELFALDLSKKDGGLSSEAEKAKN